MPKIKISQNAVKALEPGERDAFYFDDTLTGFGVKVTPQGRKSYFAQYRVNGRKRRIYIGASGVWKAQAARERAEKLLARAAIGEDPAEEKAEARRDLTVAELCDSFIEAVEAGDVLPRHGRKRKPKTIATDKGRIRRHIKPLLGARKLAGITTADVQRMQTDIANGKTARTEPEKGETLKKRARVRVTGGQGAASKSVILLSAMYEWAIKQGLAKKNPCRAVNRFRDNVVEKRLEADEIKRLGEALKAVQAKGANPKAVAILTLLLLTGARRSEIEALEWESVDTKRGLLHLGDSKTGRTTRPIGPAALVVIADQPRIDGNPYVFPAATKEGEPPAPYTGTPKIWNKVRRAAGLDGTRIHDLRHTMGSWGVDAGLSLYIVGKVLGHRKASSTERYAHLARDPAQEAAKRVSNALSAALEGKSADIKKMPGQPGKRSSAG